MNLKDIKTVSERKRFIEDILSVKLPHIGNFSLDEKMASSKNCENMIGAAQIPLGIAGPLKIQPTTHNLQPTTYNLLYSPRHHRRRLSCLRQPRLQGY